MNSKVRHVCTTWWGRLGLLGGILVLLLAAVIGPWMMLVPEASTCATPYTLSYGQIPNSTQWNANFQNVCTLWNNGISDQNVVAGANIAQSKLALLTTNALFTDHSLRHTPVAAGGTGSDEIFDLDISDTGTLVSLHGARHAPDTGVDPIPGLTGIVGTRHKYVADAGLQANVAFSKQNVGPFEGSGTNDVAMMITYCGSHVYVAVVDTATGVCVVQKVTASTMVLNATYTLATGVTTTKTIVSMVCGTDDTIYVLTAEPTVVDTVKIEKITSGGTVSTLKDFTSPALHLDGAVAMVSNPDSSFLFFTGQDNTMTNDRLIMKVATSDGTTTVADDGGGVNTSLKDLVWFNHDNTDYLAVYRQDTGGADYLRTYAASGTIVIATVEGNNSHVITDPGLSNLHAVETDGTVLYWQISDKRLGMFDLGSMVEMATTSDIDVAAAQPMVFRPENMYFDGRTLLIQSNSKYTFSFAPGVRMGASRLTDRVGFATAGKLTAGTTQPCGIASDGTHTYFCHRDNAGTQWIVTKHLSM